MHSSAALVALATAAGLASAAPLVERSAPPFPFPENFNIQVVARSHPTAFSGDYIYSYHTGAGAGIAAASSSQSDAMKGNLVSVNEKWQVAFSPQGTTDTAWYLNLEFVGSTSASATATIGASNPPDSQGFYFTDKGLMWSDPSFQYWAVCDGNYGVPQLYAVVNSAVSLPTTCEIVDLMTVPASS